MKENLVFIWRLINVWKETIYQATIKQPKNICRSSSHWFGVYKKSFEDPNYSQTTISNNIHDLKSNGIEPAVTWKILDRAKSNSPVTDVCHLEAYYIVFEPHLAQLNSRTFFNLHAQEIKSPVQTKTRKAQKSPRTWAQLTAEYR